MARAIKHKIGFLSILALTGGLLFFIGSGNFIHAETTIQSTVCQAVSSQSISYPKNNQKVTKSTIEVTGRTTAKAVVSVTTNRQVFQAEAKSDGTFRVKTPLQLGSNDLAIQSSLCGQKTVPTNVTIVRTKISYKVVLGLLLWPLLILVLAGVIYKKITVRQKKPTKQRKGK